MTYKKNWIEEGLDVAHKDNPEQKMTVNRILRQNKQIKVQEGDDWVSKTKSFIIGVEVHYWELDKDTEKNKLMIAKFHTRLLIPWEIAMESFLKGSNVITQFIKKINSL
jgi:hypothetical protein